MKKLLLILFPVTIIFSASNTLIAQWVKWEQTSGPKGGQIHSITEDDSYFYSATSGPIFRMPKDGSTWAPLPPMGTTVVSARSLSVIGTTLIAGCDGAGVYRSTDHGMTWGRWISGLEEAQSVFSFAVSGNNLYAGTNRGVYLSTDYGANWTPRNTGQDSFLVLSLLIKGSDMFAGTLGGGVYRSSDYGTSWIPVNNGLTSDGILVQWVWSLAAIDNMLFAGTWQGDGVYRSEDNGATWTTVNEGLQINAGTDIDALTTVGTTLFAGTHGGVFRTENSGNTWTRLYPGPESTVNCFHVSGTDIYAGTWDGVYLSSNLGDSWSPYYTGLIGTVINVFLRAGSSLFAGTEGSEALFRSDDDGDNWIRTNLERIHFGITSLTAGSTDLFAGTRNGVIRSIDGGYHWNPANEGIEEEAVTALAVIPYGLDDEYLFAGTDSNGVFISLDAGAHWIEANTGLTDTLVKCLAINGTNLFAGTGSGVFLSKDYGFTWTPANTGLTNTDIQCFATSNGNVYTGTKTGGVFHSSNNGTNWTPINTGLTELNVSCLTARGTYLLAGIGSITFFSENNGSKWIPVEMGLRHLSVLSLDISAKDLFAGIQGAGVYRCPLSGLITSIHQFSTDPSSGFILEQNFPNPFNNSTKICFSVPFKTKVLLKIFDQSGKEVSVVVNKEFSPGSYEVSYDGKHLSAGVYYYRMQAGEFTQTRKLVLLK